MSTQDVQMAEEALDVRLIGRGAGPAVMLGDRHQRHELTGVDRGHLRPVVRPSHEDRHSVVCRRRQPVSVEEALVFERTGEQQLRLGRGLLGREQVADPVAGDDVDDRVGDPLAPGEVGRVPDPDPVALPRNVMKAALCPAGRG